MTNLFGDPQIFDALQETEIVFSTEGSKYFKKRIDQIQDWGFSFEIWQKLLGTPLRVEKVSPEEIRNREHAYEKAKAAYDNEISRVHSARQALHEALDRMVLELTGLE